MVANFAIGTHTITATAGTGGSISPSGNIAVSHGSDQTFTITPDSCYHIADVVVDGISQGAITTYTFSNVTADHTISATFAIDTYTITATAGTGGSISPSGNVVVNCGSDQSFTLTPDTGYHIVDVVVDGSSQGATGSYTFTNVTGNHTISATFGTDTYSLSVTKAGSGNGMVTSSPVGIDCGADCTEVYDYGTSVTLTATPDTNSLFTGWTGCDSSSGNQCTITMNSDRTVTAEFFDDGDGIAPGVEDGGPNGGDGNGDGIPDRLQSGVTSLPTATGQGYITVVTTGGCSQSRNVHAYTETETPDDPRYTYPYGLVGFELPCSSATVRVYFYGITDLNGYIYRKYGPLPPYTGGSEWYTMPGVVYGTEVIGGQTVAYAEFGLTDGQTGDDTGVDGIIYDQGGPGQEQAVMAVPTMNEWGMIIFMVLAGGVAVWYMKKEQGLSG